ncbi:DUF4412 domain-containing protein [Dokdonia ponticola]|uniref:DUF4412 domain-containing protein n=1 Tax=Dokdonia ponticola TaxID=2041041 RepID=A0ABV9HZ05_9FLAO
MKITLKLVILLCFLGQFQTAEAQLLKRIKKSIENKIDPKDTEEEEADERDKEVISSLKEKDFGMMLITHSKKFGVVQIDELSQVKVIKTDDGYQMNGNWWSHEADIYDGFNLIIETSKNLKHDGDNRSKNERQTFSIPEEATLTLGYDPQLSYGRKTGNQFRPAVSDDYQNYDVSKGEVSVDVLTDGAIQISFTGKASLREVLRKSNKDGDYTETFFEATVKGAVDGNSPKFIDNTTIKKSDTTTQNSSEFAIPKPTITTATPGIYEFTFETVVKVTTSEDNQSYEISYLLNPNANYMGIKANMSDYSDEEVGGESIVVMDNGNAHIFAETSGMKMQISSQMMGNQQMNNPSDQMEKYDYSKLTKTGNTKTILGATCYEYTMSDADTKMNLWVAPDVNLPNWFVQNKEVLPGHIMEYTITSKEGSMKSETIKINDDISKVINPKEYKKMF